MSDEEQAILRPSKTTDGTGESYEPPSSSSKFLHRFAPQSLPHRWRRFFCGLVGILVATCIAGGIICGLYFGFVAANNFSRYPNSISASNMMDHLEALQAIANNHSGSRTPTTGYNASVEYVLSVLKENSNLVVTVQNFPIAYYQEPIPPTLQMKDGNDTVVFQDKVDFQSIRNQGAGTVTALIDSTPGLGCIADDYANFTVGSIALIQRGNCTFAQKAATATAAKVSGLLIANYAGQGIIAASVNPVPFPAFVISQDVALLLTASPDTEVTMFSSSTLLSVITSNIIADTVDGNSSAIIVIGSHLDGVAAGPGINDNGSGSSANLELALNINKISLTNRVRFCWWGAEELGLLGSTYYVSSLSATDIATIAMNINLDMIASPNYFRGVYNGKAASAVPACNTPACLNGSAVIQGLFQQYFGEQNLTCDETAFDGRSDYGPFLDVKIPAGGLFTGAEEVKDAAMRTRYGGLANAAYDPCYHAYCDTIDNIDQTVYQQMARAAATVIEEVAGQSDLKGYLLQGFQQSAFKDWAPCTPLSPSTIRSKRAIIDDVKL